MYLLYNKTFCKLQYNSFNNYLKIHTYFFLNQICFFYVLNKVKYNLFIPKMWVKLINSDKVLWWPHYSLVFAILDRGDIYFYADVYICKIFSPLVTQVCLMNIIIWKCLSQISSHNNLKQFYTFIESYFKNISKVGNFYITRNFLSA